MSSEQHSGGTLDGLSDDALLHLIGEAVTRIGRTELSGAVGDDALVASVETVGRLETRLAAERLRRVAEVDARGACHGQGARSAADLLAQQLGLTPGEARSQAETAKGLRRLPETAAKLAAGDLGVGHAAAAVKTLDELDRDDTVGDDTARERAAELDRRVARTPRTTNRAQLKRDLDQWSHTLGSDTLAERERRAHRDRRLWIGPDPANPSAYLIEGRLGTIDGAHVRAALAALAQPTGPDDTRDQRQRTADALVELVRRGVNASPDTTRAAAQVLLITTPESQHSRPGAPPSTLDGTPVSDDTARQVCCDADFTHTPTARNGDVLDVGRTRRDPTPRQRLAVIARDRACTGCGRAPSACQIHHRRWWGRDAGATDLDNLTLLCPNCHHHVHHEGWTVTRTADGRHRTVPPAGQAMGRQRHAA